MKILDNNRILAKWTPMSTGSPSSTTPVYTGMSIQQILVFAAGTVQILDSRTMPEWSGLNKAYYLSDSEDWKSAIRVLAILVPFGKLSPWLVDGPVSHIVFSM